ncbi:hypothetical protein K438DRAFT_1773885 [Mycena galopus ATCC 62051]|nr:hypothetical protein K438DRAFT_1773885 [Mycena galopus ATCC 62051]
MSTGKLPLRILYSVNGSAQYILARSQGAVPVEFIPSHGIETGAGSSRSPPPPRYASASLKTCLNTICRSSPEITQDPNLDFSVYLLDPLEMDCVPAQHMSAQPSAAEAPESQVAVGLGLMSWALMADETDATPATGTLKVSGAGKEVLELIFSLRQAIPMPEASRSWSKPTTSTAKANKPTVSSNKGKKPVPYQTRRPARSIVAPTTESDKILAVAPIYVGPERRPQGRPPWQIESEAEEDEVVVVDDPQRPGNPCKNPPNPSKDPFPDPSQDPSPNPSKDPSESSLLDFLAYLNTMPDFERNNALGNVLSLVHGPDGTAINHPPAELANAMTLFSDLQRHQAQPDNAPSSHNQHRRKSSNDDEIVLLNKENVNPKVFRRRGERDTKLSGSQPSTVPSSGLPPSAPPQDPPQPPAAVPSNPPLRRKRTLSEFMAEQESLRDKEKALKKTHYHRQPGQRSMERSMSNDSFLPHTTMPPPTRAPLPTKPFDPPKPRRRINSSASSPGRGFFTETAIAVPPRPSSSASSPVRPPRKSFVLPDWAQTNTATKPRLSDRALEKMDEEEMKKRVEELNKRRKRDLKRKEKEGKEGSKRRPGTSTSVAATVEHQTSASTSTGTKPCAEESSLPALVAASIEFPAFSREPTSRSPFAALPFGSPSRSASQNNIPPCTPPRRRRASTIGATPEASNSLFTPDANSLFTPVPNCHRVLDFGRRSMSPSFQRPRPQETEQTRPSGEPEPDGDDLLGQELESAFDDLDFPPSSLPIASSDVDVNMPMDQMPGSSREYDSDDGEDDAPPKQHWVGLPPSSPPPLSSPYLGPSPMDDDDVEEAPLPTPDADLASEQETLDSPDTEVVNYSTEELDKLFNIEDLADLFPPSATDADAVYFDQFPSSSLDDASQPMKDWEFDVTGPDFDFSEFWESVKPLVESSSQDMNPSVEHPGAGAMDGVDHAKLAGDVHALFSGCLV